MFIYASSGEFCAAYRWSSITPTIPSTVHLAVDRMATMSETPEHRTEYCSVPCRHSNQEDMEEDIDEIVDCEIYP